MNLTPEVKAEIDALSYVDLLRRWRYAPVGDEMFRGESGQYWKSRMFELKKTVDHVAASKEVG